MLDCQLFGLEPGAHLFINIVIHLLNTLVLYVLVQQMTGAVWRSALVALFFAIHPLHVESVAWASERKDVLSCLFWLLTMLAYVRYVRKPAISTYLLTLLLFGFGLISKPMVVTLPFVLLLIDFWPLGRFHSRASPTTTGEVQPLGAAPSCVLLRTPTWLVAEKIPFFILTALASIITYIV